MPGPPRWRRLLWVAVAGMVVAGLLLGLQFVRLARNHLGSDPTAPFFVGTAWHLDEELAARGIRATVTSGNGYDGQWFLGLALDPLLRGHLAAGFDMPRYRARRPLFAMAGWVLGGGRPDAAPVALEAVELLAVAAGCAAAGRVAAACGRSRWWGLGFVAVPGVAVGVMFGTAEPLGLALAVVGLSLTLERRLVAGGLAFAGAGLTKETYLGFAVAAAIWLLARPELGTLGWRRRLRQAASVAVPGAALLAAWWWYVALMLPASPGDAGLEALSLPLLGWAHTLGRIAGGRYLADAPVGALGPAVLVAMFALLVAAVPLTVRARALLDWTGLLMGCYGLLIAGALLDRFLSATRALAPCVLGAGLALLAARRVGAGPRALGPPAPPPFGLDPPASHVESW